MGKKLRIIGLLIACLFFPLLSTAQSQQSNNLVSVRELSIPPKALHAFEQGIDLLSKKDAAGSVSQFQHAIAEFAGYYEAYYKMGVADLRLWRITDAEQAFRKSMDLSGNQYAPPLLALGAVLIYQEKFPEAEGVTRKGLDLDPTSWSGHYFLGWALFGLNRLEEAENSVHEALRWRNDSAEARLLLVDIHSREKNYPALLNDVDEYLRRDPDSPAGARARALRDNARRALSQSQSASAVAQPQP
jgi:tetratricopeptide (TPR) repeat protein